MSRALAKIDWIEQKSIQADGGTLLVKFGVNDKKSFNLETIKDALSSKYRRGVEVVEGP